MPCHAMLCLCQTKSCPGLTQSSFLTSTRLFASTSSAASTGVGRGRRRLPETATVLHQQIMPAQRYPFPRSWGTAAARVAVTWSRRPQGTRDSPPPPAGGPLGTTRNGTLVPMVAHSEPSALLLLLRLRLRQSRCRHSRERALGPPQHPICGGPSVQHVVSESCVLWHCVPCTHRSTPLLQAAD